MKFKVGDRVRFREWEDMVKEFGTDDENDISVSMDQVYFLHTMRFLCGEEFVVTDMYDGSFQEIYGAEEVMLGHRYTITSDMLEIVEEDIELDDANNEELDEFLNMYN